MKLWIAREKSGGLFFFDKEPVKNEFGFIDGMSKDGIPTHLCGHLTNDCLQEVTFENSPREVELKLVSKTMVDKACEWLGNNLTNYESNMMGYIHFSQIEEIIKDFRKAMEK